MSINNTPSIQPNMADPLSNLKRKFPTGLPFSVTSAVAMCWGLTLRLSHETQQQKLGEEFFNEIIRGWDNNIRNDLPPKYRHCYSQFNMILARTTRNLAFLRLAHVRHLNKKAREYLELRDFLNSIGDIAFSKESIPLKLVSFFGGGLWSLSKINPFKEGFEALIIFVFFGLIGIFVINILFKTGTHYYLHHKEDELKKKQNRYYADKYLSDMTRALYDYCEDIKNLLKRFYEYTPSSATEEDDPLLVKSKKEAEEYIKDKVLPTVEIDWDIWLIPAERLSVRNLQEKESIRPVLNPETG